MPTPGTITTYAGGMGEGAATTISQKPYGLAIRGSTLYIADIDHHVVRALDTSTGIETVVAGNGAQGSTGDGGQARAAQLSIPTGLALDSNGNLYISTQSYWDNDPNNRIRKVTPGGIITTVAGGGSVLGDGVPATTVALAGPSGLAVDAAGNLFIADTHHNRIRKVDQATGLITTVAGTGTYQYSGDGGLATAAALGFPADVSVDAGGNLWIADGFSRRIREVVAASGKIFTMAGSDAVGSACPSGSATATAPGNALTPSGVSFDGSGNLIIANAGLNCVSAVVGGSYVTLAGGASGFGGDGGPATSALMKDPVRAVKDSAGNLYISDSTNLRVRRVDKTTNVITTLAGTGTQCAASGDGGQATAATMCYPGAVALDSAGNLFVVDNNFFHVRKVTPAGVITTVAGNGTQGSGGDLGPATSAQLFSPTALAADSGNLFIADSHDHVVRRVNRLSGVITRYAGTGTACPYSGDGGPATGATACIDPSGLALDLNGNLLIADGSSIRQVGQTGIISTRATFTGGVGVKAIAVDTTGSILALSSDGRTVWKVTGAAPATSIGSSLGLGFNGQAIAAGPQNQVVVTGDDCRVHVFAASGVVTVAGTGICFSITGDGGPATSAGMGRLAGIAINAGGDMFATDLTRVRRIQAYTAPSAPPSVQTTAGDTQATVSWGSPSSNGGLPLVRYSVTTRNGARANSPIFIDGAPPATSTVVRGLADHTTYTFTVSASNGWDTGAESSSAPVMPTITDGHITTYGGGVGIGPGLSVGQLPFALAMDGGHLYISDWATPAVRDLDTVSGQETVRAGNGAFDYSGDGGSPAAAALRQPGALVNCGTAGATFIADTFNYRIRKVQGGTITTVVGNGVRGYSGDGGPATQAQISHVFGLACGAGNPNVALYIADSDNGVIRALDVNGNISTLWLGLSFPTGIATMDASTILVADSATNVVWYLNQLYGSCVVAGTRATSYNCHTGSAINTKLSDPRGLAWDGMTLYIADAGNNKVRMVDSAGNISTIAGNGIGGFAGDGFPAVNAQLNHPTSLVFNGTLYVADANNYRVRRFTVGGNITTIAGNGTPSLFGDGGAATSAQVGNPYAVAVDAAGNEYVADNQNDVIRKIDVNGVITTVAGNGTNGYSGDQGPATSAQLNDPRGVAVDANGNIYISDTGNQRIRKVDSVTGKISTIAGTGAAGYSGDGGAATSARIDSPRALAIDASGNVYIADTGNNRVRKVTGTTISTFAGTGTAGFSGEGGLASAAQLSGPRGLVINAAGELLISDTGNNRVRKVAADTKITTVAGSAMGGSAGDGGPATSAQLNFPFGLAVDGSGNLFIADTSNHKIRVVGTDGTISTVVAFCGAGFAGDGGVATLAHLNTPYGVAADSLGNLLIADANNNRIRGARGVLGLIGQRAATCQSPDSTAQPRGSANSSGQSTPPPRLADQGGRLRIAGGLPAATSPVVRPSLAALGNTTQQAAGAGNAIGPIAGQVNAAPASTQAPVERDQPTAPAPTVEIPVPRQQPAARVQSVNLGEAAPDPVLSLVLLVGALLIVLPRGRNHRERRLQDAQLTIP